MKTKLLFLALLLLSCVNGLSQTTSLTVDCQTPGWLASYINPTEVQNIRSLTVTGVINSTDLATIGNLVKNYQLNERLNLENVDIEGNNLSGEMFGVSDCQLQFLSLPLSVTKLENCVDWVKLDTLVCGSELFPVFRLSEYRPKIDAKHLILREGVEYYMYVTEQESPIEEIVFPNSLKYIYQLDGSNLSKINIPPAIEHLGSIIGTKLNLNGDTIYIPSTVKCLYDNWGTGGYRNGYLGSSNRDENGKIKCVYLPEGLDTLWVSQLYGYSGSPYTDPGAKVDIHIKAKTPPKVQNATLGYNTIVYVPVGYKEVYKNTGANTQYGAGQWGGATILEEVYAEQVEIDAPERFYVGDSQKLTVDVTPSNTTFKDVTWGVSDSAILSVTKEGMCSGINYGEAIVSAINADRSCMDTKLIKVYEHTTAMTLDNNSIELIIGGKATLNATTLPEGTSDGKTYWSTSNKFVATVDANGTVIGNGQGTCTITATSVDGGFKATCEVAVNTPYDNITDITIGSAGMGTFCSTHSLDFSGTNDIKAYIVSAFKPSTGEVTLTRITDVPANTGIVVKGDADTYAIPWGTGETVVANMLVGVTENIVLNKVDGDYTNYILAKKNGNLGFYAVTDGSTLSAGKAYLPLPTTQLPSGAAARQMTMILEDEITGIQKAIRDIKRNDDYYDLQGRRVSTPTRGLYIVNGKKVIVK